MADCLTGEQLAAVENRGHRLLVSAAAGSGKTRVLVERLFSVIEKEDADLDDFLIITYTRAAAAELRGKIAAALSDRLSGDPENRLWQRQLLRVYRADIKTVDAFCTALLRENCHLLREDEQHRTLRPDFRVLDEQEAAELRGRVLSRTIDSFYESLTPGDGGTQLADTLGAGRDDRTLSALVLELYGKVQAQAYPEQWLRKQAERWENLPPHIDDTTYGPLLLKVLRDKALHWAVQLERGAAEMVPDAKLSGSYGNSFLTVAAQLRTLASASEQGWDFAQGALFVFPRLAAARKTEDEALRQRMKCLWDACRKSVGGFGGWFSASGEEAMADLRMMAPAMTALLRLTKDFSRAYQTEKRRRNSADFSDQEHEAIRLLLDDRGQPTDLARTVANRYREIMVDEYQDTNEVQNRIFEAVSQNGTNLFTVGDVKQSIYRFRLADPTIFLEHYTRYPPVAEAAEGEPGKLVLSRNFRSRREVLEAANFVFSNILSAEMGELDYGPQEALYPGAAYPPCDTCRTEFHLVCAEEKTDGKKAPAAETEALFVASYVRKLLDGGLPITDAGTKQLRPVCEEDIVILMRSPRARLALYRQALEAQGVAVSADANEDLLASVEVSVVMSLLEVLDNPRQDVPLIAVLRSPLFGFTADRLAILRAAAPEGDFYDALLHGEGEDTERFLSLLRELREAAQCMSLCALLSLIYMRCNVLGIFGAMRGGRERKENLIAFSALAEGYEENGYRGLFSFVLYIRRLRENNGLPKPASSAGGVRIMSIHKSKGLEFPVVILSDLAKRFSNMDFTASVLVHPRYGLGPECVDTARRIHYPTAAKQALDRTLRRETKAEELRILYVAMTRAKEKLIMVHTQANPSKRVSELLTAASCPALPESVDDCKCMGEWIMLPLLCRPEAEPLRELTGFDCPAPCLDGGTPWDVFVHRRVEDAGKLWQTAGAEDAPETDEGFAPDETVLTWEYPYAEAAELSAKLTATQLKGREADAEIAEHAKLPPRLRGLKRPLFISGRDELSGAERGTAIHLVLEHLDLYGGDSEAAVREQVNAMRLRRLLTENQAKAVDAQSIARFLRSPIAQRIRKSKRVEREYRFSILRSARDYIECASGDDAVLLQGVVDLFFEENGALVVVDFKTDRITEAETAARAAYYAPQLETYASALERIMEMPVCERLLYFFATGECVPA